MDGYGYADPARRGVVHHRAPVCRAGAAPAMLCKREDGVIVIQGKTYDGTGARSPSKGGGDTTAKRTLAGHERGNVGRRLPWP